MSLATSSGMAGSGGGAAGGMVMAHQANAVGQGAAPPPPQATASSGISGGAPIFVGADLADKNQSLSLKQVKNVSHLPLVAMDLHAKEPHVAYFPPKPEDPSRGDWPVLVGKMKASVYLKANETAQKTLRKYLAQSKTYLSLQADTLSKASDSKAVVVLDKPQRWLGVRRLSDAPGFFPEASTEQAKKSHAIDQEENLGVGAFLINSTLDGSSAPTGDDFDRVVWKVRLTESKKALAVLPEEAVQTLLHQAQYHVATKRKTDHEDEEIVDYPCAIALPAWCFHDAAIEALLEACSSGAVIFPRGICALAGALLPPTPDGGKASALLQRVLTVRKASQQEHQKQLVKDHDAVWEEDVTLILVGNTEDGLEMTAVQISSENGKNACALFGNFKVISNVSYQSKEPFGLMKQCAAELETEVDRIAPEADGPAGIVFYGCDQDKLKSAWKAPSEWEKVPVFTTKSDAVALGCAALGAVSHGRSTRIRSVGNKTKPELAIQVQNVAPCAVGVRLCYNGQGKKVDWSSVPVKTVFDFDRRIPAGPFAIDLNAAECAVHRTGAEMSDEELLKAIQETEGSKGIPKREVAALNLRVQVVQKWTRDGEWKQVGDVMKPLVKLSGDGEDSKEEACEKVTLELSLGVTGMITSNLVGELESVVQATASARQSAIRYYIGILVAILFFGGFMVRSYYEEYAFKRDVKRLLAYYEHIIPGSMADGDEQNARYLVWKYRNKKDRLWKMLEKKYGEVVLHPDEWTDSNEEGETKEEEEVDLDKEEGSENESSENGKEDEL